MSDYLNVDGVIDITVKDKFGNIKTKNTVRNAVSDLGKMIFLYEGAKVCTLETSLMSAYLSDTFQNVYVPSCLSLLNLNDNHLNTVKGNGGVVSYILTDSGEVVFCEYNENGDETSGFTKIEVDSGLFQFVAGKRYSFKTGSIVGSINAIAMTGGNTCSLPAINLFKRFGIGKVRYPYSFSSHFGYMLPGIIYNKGKDNEVRWTEPDEVLFRFCTESSEVAVGVRLLTGDVTFYNTVADRYPEDKYPTVDRSLKWKDICIIGVRDYGKVVREEYPTAVIKNNLYIMGYTLKHYVIGSSNITEGSELPALTASYYPNYYDNFIALVYDYHSIKVIYYSKSSTNANYLDSIEIPLNEYGAPDIWEDDFGGSHIDVNATSTEVNSDLSLAGESQYYECGIDFRTIPAFIRKQFGVRNREPLITQIQDKYYLAIKGGRNTDTPTCTPIYEFTDLSDIKGSMTGKVLSAVYDDYIYSPNPIMYVDDSLSYVISPYFHLDNGSVYSVLSGPNWCGNIISMRVLDEPLVVTEEDTLEITYMYTTGDFSSTNFIAENTDGNKPISVG